MIPFLKKHHRVLFYVAWLVLNLYQATYTELFDDEAYYWMYTRYPAWGYFDHPPMIAWLIQLGYAIFHNELGVRLLVVLMNTSMVLMIEQLLSKKRTLLFYAICASMALLQIGGMIAVPDLPLLFFAVLFFLLYDRFSRSMSTCNTFLLAVVISLMLYSKYHGVLIVFFTLLSNPSLFRKPQTYLVAILSLLFFSPHLYWQFTHHFPSIQFHLFERNASTYKFSFTLDYLAGQLLLAGPFIGWLLIWSAIRYHPLSKTEKALKFTMVGFYLFFLVSSFKGRVEANWTIPAMIGVIVLSHQFLQENRFEKWVYRTAPLTLFFVLLIRIYMIADLPRFTWLKKDEFHHNRQWTQYIQEKAKGKPVVFINSYQKPSKLHFYAGSLAFSMNTPKYRRNNFNYWPIEDSLMGKSVLVTGRYDSIVLNEKVTDPAFDNAGMKIFSSFYSFSKVQLTEVEVKKSTAHQVNLSFNISSPENYLPYFSSSPGDSAHVQLAINKADSIFYYPSIFSVEQIKQASMHVNTEIKVELLPGKYRARLAISSAVPTHPTLNSVWFTLKAE